MTLLGGCSGDVLFQVGELVEEHRAELLEAVTAGGVGVDADGEVVAVAPGREVEPESADERTDRAEVDHRYASQREGVGAPDT